MAGRKLSFHLRGVSEAEVAKAIHQLKAKKSSGIDGVSQELLKQVASVIIVPLTLVINKSISSGVFPHIWKRSRTVPIHKKGDKTLVSNYRPVSCLPAASKVLERVVLTQLETFVEKNQLLPKNQHGFRSNRSTETALASMVAEWSKKHDDGLHTGILLWDLSSAFDTIDVNILCDKLMVYGLSEKSVGWFRSYLTNRQQQIEIGNCLSQSETVSVGCPQGALLSPLLFILYVADLELWIPEVNIHGYADDFTTAVSARDEADVIRNLETNAKTILRYMASNYLAVNPQKTCFMIIRSSRKDHQVARVKIGDSTIDEENCHSILGVTVNNTLTWTDHVYGSRGLLSSVKQRVGTLRRLSYQIPRSYLSQIASAVVAAKIRYGIAVYGSVRKNETEPIANANKDLQVMLNKAMRIATGCRLADRVSVSDLTGYTGIQSVNRMSAQSKIMLAWQGVNVPNSSLDVYFGSAQSHTSSRIKERGDIRAFSRSSFGQRNFPDTAIRLWNSTPQDLRKSEKKQSAKTNCKKHVNSLPLL